MPLACTLQPVYKARTLGSEGPKRYLLDKYDQGQLPFQKNKKVYKKFLLILAACSVFGPHRSLCRRWTSCSAVQCKNWVNKVSVPYLKRSAVGQTGSPMRVSVSGRSRGSGRTSLGRRGHLHPREQECEELEGHQCKTRGFPRKRKEWTVGITTLNRSFLHKLQILENCSCVCQLVIF